MGTRARKTETNIPLKVAILERRLTQREVARRADIAEVRMSRIALGKDAATDDERRAIAKVLRRGVSRLFPVEAVA